MAGEGWGDEDLNSCVVTMCHTYELKALLILAQKYDRLLRKEEKFCKDLYIYLYMYTYNTQICIYTHSMNIYMYS